MHSNLFSIIIFMWLFFLDISRCQNVKANLHILGLFEDDMYLKSAEEALKDIAERQDLLTNYNLTLHSASSMLCNVGIGTKELFRLIYSPPTKIIVLGDGCSDVCLSTGLSTSLFNMVQISYQALAPGLSNKNKYPMFFRTIPSNTGVVTIRELMMLEFGWKDVATLMFKWSINEQINEEFRNRLRETNSSILLSEEYNMNSMPNNFKVLKEHHAKIIFATFVFEQEAFCQIYKENLYGPKYVWILNSFGIDWWNKTVISCNTQEFKLAVEGSFHITNQIYEFSNDETFSKRDKHDIKSKDMDSFTYDATWAIALALNTAAPQLRSLGKPLEGFTYNDSEIGNIIFENMKKVNFKGVSGPVEFNSVGDVKRSYIIRRIIGGEAIIIGTYTEEDDNINWLKPVIWQGGNPPSDQPVITFQKLGASGTLFNVVCAITVLVLLLTCGFFIFSVFLRTTSLKLVSLNMDALFLIGCFICPISLFIQSSDEVSQRNCCVAFRFIYLMGFSLGLGALFSKIWRIYNIGVTKRGMTSDQFLIILIAIYFAINMLLLTIWEGVDPAVIHLSNKTIEDFDGDITIYQSIICDSPKAVYFRATLYGIQAFLLLFSCYLSWQIRKVSLPGFRDSRILGMCIYNILVLSIIGIGVAIVVDNATIDYAVKAASILIGNTATECIIFIKQIRDYRSGKLHQENTVSLQTENSINPFPSMQSDNIKAAMGDELHDVIEQRDKDFNDLRLKIESRQSSS